MSRPARPKYQVFISSTYADLHDEREAVTWAILKSRHIPAGMENFSAHPDRGWKIIQQTIDSSDCYVLLVAGRYGAVDSTNGLSWTEREYDYAHRRGLSILAFIRDQDTITADKIEKDPENQDRLVKFVERVKANHLYEGWHDSTDLCNKVSSALLKQINDDEDDEKAPPGWYRGDQIPASGTLDEFARLSAENKALKNELAKRSTGNVHLELQTQDLSPLPDKQETILEHDSENHIDIIYRLMIANTGTTSAHNVVADFLCSGGGETAPSCHVFSIQFDNTRKFINTTTQHFCNTSRVRIQSIGVNGFEPLPDLLIRVKPDGAKRFDGELLYRLVNEDGSITTGKQRLLLSQK
jgi:hypothetical protein